MAVGSQCERTQPAQDEEAVERARHGTHRVLEEPQPFGSGRFDGDAVDGVRVAAEILRRRVEDDVGAEVDRSLDRRRANVWSPRRAGFAARAGVAAGRLRRRRCR
jgi:hypothetical protein